jgi:hypothetical protein
MVLLKSVWRTVVRVVLDQHAMHVSVRHDLGARQHAASWKAVLS